MSPPLKSWRPSMPSIRNGNRADRRRPCLVRFIDSPHPAPKILANRHSAIAQTPGVNVYRPSFPDSEFSWYAGSITPAERIAGKDAVPPGGIGLGGRDTGR